MSALIRVFSFVRKESVEVVRQPRLLLTLVIGPFIILLIFGAGLREVDPPLRTMFVAPPDQELAEEVREFAEGQGDRLIVEGMVEDEHEAMRELRAGAIDLVIAFPDDVEERVREGEQARISLYHAQLDPIEAQAIYLFMRNAVAEVNQQVLATTIGEGQEDSEELRQRVAEARDRLDSARAAARADDDGEAAIELARLRADTAALLLAAGPAMAAYELSEGTASNDVEDEETLAELLARVAEQSEEMDDADAVEAEGEELDQDLATLEELLGEFQTLPPEVLVAPFDGEVLLVAGEELALDAFYAPAVVVVLLQHLLVSFVSLSVVRERELGTPELYRIAPLRSGELMLGKYIAHVLIAAVVGAALVATLVGVLGIPMNGHWLMLAVVLGAVLLASAGLGFAVAGVSQTASQAVQYTMLVLLATIFFSGFTLSLDRFVPAFRWVGLLLPATYGVRLTRDVMLAGIMDSWVTLGLLLAFAVVLGGLGWLAVRRRLLRT